MGRNQNNLPCRLQIRIRVERADKMTERLISLHPSEFDVSRKGLEMLVAETGVVGSSRRSIRRKTRENQGAQMISTSIYKDKKKKARNLFTKK